MSLNKIQRKSLLFQMMGSASKDKASPGLGLKTSAAGIRTQEGNLLYSLDNEVYGV